MRKNFVVLIVLLVLAIAGYNHIYQEHKNVREEIPAFTMTSSSLLQEFLINFEKSELKYSDKIILVSGNISEIHQNSITLNETIFCQFDTDFAEFVSQNSTITIKGRFIGYDDLLEQIKLDQCSIVNIN
jgi:hypothetical protein